MLQLKKGKTLCPDVHIVLLYRGVVRSNEYNKDNASNMETAGRYFKISHEL